VGSEKPRIAQAESIDEEELGKEVNSDEDSDYIDLK